MANAAEPGSLCHRCGYDLRSIADDAPCPECGLLAIRSRRESDELHHVHPMYLRTLAVGSQLILLGIVTLAGLPFVLIILENMRSRWWRMLQQERWFYAVLACHIPVIMILVGNTLLTRPEDQVIPNKSDARLRKSLRIASWALLAGAALLLACCDRLAIRLNDWTNEVAFPLFAVAISGPFYMACRAANRAIRMAALSLWLPTLLIVHYLLNQREQEYPLFQPASILFTTIVLLALPLLTFLQLRSLAVRARCPRLAEHCLIVGVGASSSVFFSIAMFAINTYGDTIFGNEWYRTDAWLVLMAVFGSIAGLFALWALFLFLRFTLAFTQTSYQRRRDWKRDDRSIAMA